MTMSPSSSPSSNKMRGTSVLVTLHAVERRISDRRIDEDREYVGRINNHDLRPNDSIAIKQVTLGSVFRMAFFEDTDKQDRARSGALSSPCGSGEKTILEDDDVHYGDDNVSISASETGSLSASCFPSKSLKQVQAPESSHPRAPVAHLRLSMRELAKTRGIDKEWHLAATTATSCKTSSPKNIPLNIRPASSRATYWICLSVKPCSSTTSSKTAMTRQAVNDVSKKISSRGSTPISSPQKGKSTSPMLRRPVVEVDQAAVEVVHPAIQNVKQFPRRLRQDPQVISPSCRKGISPRRVLKLSSSLATPQSSSTLQFAKNRGSQPYGSRPQGFLFSPATSGAGKLVLGGRGHDQKKRRSLTEITYSGSTRGWTTSSGTNSSSNSANMRVKNVIASPAEIVGGDKSPEENSLALVPIVAPVVPSKQLWFGRDSTKTTDLAHLRLFNVCGFVRPLDDAWSVEMSSLRIRSAVAALDSLLQEKRSWIENEDLQWVNKEEEALAVDIQGKNWGMQVQNPQQTSSTRRQELDLHEVEFEQLGSPTSLHLPDTIVKALEDYMNDLKMVNLKLPNLKTPFPMGSEAGLVAGCREDLQNNALSCHAEATTLVFYNEEERSAEAGVDEAGNADPLVATDELLVATVERYPTLTQFADDQIAFGRDPCFSSSSASSSADEGADEIVEQVRGRVLTAHNAVDHEAGQVEEDDKHKVAKQEEEEEDDGLTEAPWRTWSAFLGPFAEMILGQEGPQSLQSKSATIQFYQDGPATAGSRSSPQSHIHKPSSSAEKPKSNVEALGTHHHDHHSHAEKAGTAHHYSRSQGEKMEAHQHSHAHALGKTEAHQHSHPHAVGKTEAHQHSHAPNVDATAQRHSHSHTEKSSPQHSHSHEQDKTATHASHHEAPAEKGHSGSHHEDAAQHSHHETPAAQGHSHSHNEAGQHSHCEAPAAQGHSGSHTGPAAHHSHQEAPAAQGHGSSHTRAAHRSHQESAAPAHLHGGSRHEAAAHQPGVPHQEKAEAHRHSHSHSEHAAAHHHSQSHEEKADAHRHGHAHHEHAAKHQHSHPHVEKPESHRHNHSHGEHAEAHQHSHPHHEEHAATSCTPGFFFINLCRRDTVRRRSYEYPAPYGILRLWHGGFSAIQGARRLRGPARKIGSSS
ncbi:unnamed protein product [Amoebophrya sp. A25]|nr:unnamed protein product [Amoebophrya sp. A25]|eukprot:GSA25T00027481001.1